MDRVTLAGLSQLDAGPHECAVSQTDISSSCFGTEVRNIKSIQTENSSVSKKTIYLGLMLLLGDNKIIDYYLSVLKSEH